MKKLLIIITILTGLIYGRCKLNYRYDIPVKAKRYIPIVIKESNIYVPYVKSKEYFPALIEHESCITLCSKRCWDPKSRLKTKREEGAGLPQLTRVFRKNGTVKWDTIANLKKKYREELKELSWDNVYDRPDLQIKAMLLLWRDIYNHPYLKYIDPEERIWFTDSGYNGGLKWLYREMKLCKLTKGCNDEYWFDNVELIKSKRAKRKLYGNRTAWDINRHHVRNVRDRMLKYFIYLRYCCKESKNE